MAAAQVKQLDFDASQVDGGLIGEYDVGFTGLFDAQEIGADVFVGDDIDSHLADVDVAAGVIAVMVGVEQILHRQGRHGLHLRQDVGYVFGIFVVDQDQAFGSDAESYVAGLVDQAVVGSVGAAAAGAAGEKGAADYVQAVFHFFGAHGAAG